MADRVAELVVEVAQIRARLDTIEAELTALQNAAANQTEAEEPAASPGGLSLTSPGDTSASEGQPAAAPESSGLSLAGSASPEADASPPAAPAAAEEENENSALLRRLGEITDAVSNGVGSVAAKDIAFIGKAQQLLAQKGPGAVAGSTGDQLILKCIRTEFKNLAKYSFPAYDRLWAVIDPVEKAFIDHAERKLKIRIFPHPGESPQEAGLRVPEAAGNIAEQKVPSLKPEGSVVAVLQRGAVAPNGSVQQAVVALSGGAATETIKLVLQVGDALAKAAKGGEVAGVLNSSVRNLAGGSPENVVLRELLNALWTANVDKTLAPAIQRIQEILQQRFGWHIMRVHVGEMFGEKHSPSQFERRKVTSDQKPGKIVSILRPGFIDKSGVPVQKAIVGVSAGR